MKEMQAFFDELAAQGRNGDTMLAHITPQEAKLLKALGGAGTINPKTGLPEFWGFKIGPIGIGSSYGGVSVGNTSLADVGSGVEDVVRDIGSGAEDVVRDVGSSVDDFVNDTIPGGWTTVALVAGGYYYYPEIEAWVAADGSTVAASDVVATNAATDQAMMDLAASTAPEIAAPELTAAQVSDMIAAEQASNITAAETLDMIAAEQAAAAKAAATGAGAATAAGAAAGASGVSQALQAAQLGLIANAITGDPLGLGGGGGDGGGNSGGTSGFAQVPIPAEWTSPTYTYSPVQNVSFEDLFPGVSLQGTQWQGLQNAQPNVTFNDIFASGMQQTPMGTPVDINQIVGSILGQNAKS